MQVGPRLATLSGMESFLSCVVLSCPLLSELCRRAAYLAQRTLHPGMASDPPSPLLRPPQTLTQPKKGDSLLTPAQRLCCGVRTVPGRRAGPHALREGQVLGSPWCPAI